MIRQIDENPGWDTQRWPDFSAAEMSCRHCGAFYNWPDFMDSLQNLRTDIAAPLLILSAHRCPLHNAHVGGAPLSQHLKLAADISLTGHNRFLLRERAKVRGFTGFGYYTTFLHIDMGRTRHWFGSSKARQLWQMH
eukprot:GHVR01074533.1.p1 GENE.GHVR01074533.1~~GHVR01074533.1.p1  ORF type:complete len:136 (+),score=2.67 GHVR01074533.1:260-667(+)